MENARVDKDDRAAEETPRDHEPQTGAVKEDVRATRAAEAQPGLSLVSQPNESSSATIVDGTVEPPMKLQVESTAPSSWSSPTSSSPYSSSSSEVPVSTPPAAHEPPESERRSKNGNPLDKDGKPYLWNVWPLSRKKKPRATW